MKWKDYIKDKMLLIISIILALVSIEILLLACPIGIIVKVYIALIVILVVAISIFVEYKKKKSFYDQLLKNMENLKEKYLISEIIKTPNFIEGKILKEILQDTGKSMLENVNYYKNIQEDYKEYIELWIHEVKIPIAASKLMIENNKDIVRHGNENLQSSNQEIYNTQNKKEIIRSIDEELDKIENYTEQALYYARSSAVEKDYMITKTNLKEIVNSAILKNKKDIVKRKSVIRIKGLGKKCIHRW